METTRSKVNISFDEYLNLMFTKRDFDTVKRIMERTKSNYLDETDYCLLKMICGIEDEKEGAEK